MRPEDYEKMANPAAAFYLMALSEALSGMIGGVYSGCVPKEIQAQADFLTKYFRAQLPFDGFTVTEVDWT